MTCRIQARRSPEQPEPRVSPRVPPAGPREPAGERPRRIDADPDDCAGGDTRGTSIASDPCGEAVLDGDVS